MMLRCDYDDAIPRQMAARVQFVARVFALRVRFVRYDRTRRGHHMVVDCRGAALSPTETVLAQALLGSDWKREAYNAGRARVLSRQPSFWRESSRWNVLYHRHWRKVDV